MKKIKIMALITVISFCFCISACAEDVKPQKNQGEGGYSISQAVSDNAQLTTISFSGLAFITGNSGADTFMPPGKVADFFGFQYMRDVDEAGYGHNTQFLSKAANTTLYILNSEQKAKLVNLAKEQASIYVDFAYNRFPIMNAFRRSLEKDIPEGSDGLSMDAVGRYTANLYKYDADLSYNRALVLGEIISSFTDEQKAQFASMKFNDFSTWMDVPEDSELKSNMSNVEFVAVMTYASELFSWYKGNVDADIYFCPERHGTYFGGFFMKDYNAMNNPDYFISTSVTGDSGKEFLNTLTSVQREKITSILTEQKQWLDEIVDIRTKVSNELRKSMTGGTIDKDLVYKLIERYGELDGMMSALYAKRFSEVNNTLTEEQRTKLVQLRDLDVVPDGAYRFSTAVEMPEIPNTDYLFGIGDMPSDAGNYIAPQAFAAATEDRPQEGQKPQGDDKPEKGQKPRGVKVSFNGQDLKFDIQPFIDQNNRTQVPIRIIAETMGAEVSWEENGELQTVTIKKDGNIIKLKIGEKQATVNGEVRVLDTACVVKSDRTFVPIRFISEILGAAVNWDGTSNTVVIEQ